MAGEVYFCGGCKREWPEKSSNMKCPGCGKITVTLNSRESHSAAIARWKLVNGIR